MQYQKRLFLILLLSPLITIVCLLVFQEMRQRSHYGHEMMDAEEVEEPDLVNLAVPEDYDQRGCPRVPVSFSGMTGRLGNIICTYVNFIALEYKLGYKYHLPQYCDKESRI